jgi:RHS repeat-associated protein
VDPLGGPIHADGLGSIRRLTDEAGNITDGYTYSAFGELLAHTGSDPQPYAFTAEPLDPNSGWQYHRARWLDPKTGRFTGMDPWEGLELTPRSLHKYLYVGASPADRVDPTGQFEGGLIGLSIANSIRITVMTIQTNIGMGVMDQVQYGGNAGLESLAISSALPLLLTAVAVGTAIGIRHLSTVMRFRSATRFVGGAKVVSFGKVVATGTVDVGPTLERIAAGKKLPYPHDATVFRNLEQRLPLKSDPKYYQEFVHPTPGISGAGPQRVVIGKGGEAFYTPDHYMTFTPLN